jgi:hypothetical protein
MENPRTDHYLRREMRENTAVCVVTESHSQQAVIGDIARRQFPGAGVEPFMCAVTYAVEIGDVRLEAMVTGPRIVAVSNARTREDDGRRTVDLEILEMYLAGFANSGSLVTVRGGRKLGLPAISGQVEAVTPESDFPASVYFDLTLELNYWG